jgi:magnesium transporter
VFTAATTALRYRPAVIVDCAVYQHGKRMTDTLAIGDVDRWLAEPGAFVWLGLRMPSRDELEEVAEHFGLDDFDVDEALAPHARPVLERTAGLTWLVLRTTAYDDAQDRVTLGEMSVLFGPSFVITIRYGPASPLKDLRRQLEREVEPLRRGPASVFAEIVGKVVDDYRVALDGVERDAVAVEAEVFDQARVRPVKRIYLLKRQVTELSMAIDALNDPLNKLVRDQRGPCSAVTDELQLALDQLGRSVRRARGMSELLTSALDANLTQVTVQQNADMRKISAWVAIAAVPTMIAGLYGMNFDHMPELGWRFGYPAVLLLIGGVCTFMYRAFRRSGWL